MRFFLTLALVAIAATAFAQDPADIYHKTIDLDSVNTVSFDVYEKDEVEYRTWPGDDILVETSVKLNNGQPHILKFYLDRGRYNLEENLSGDQLTVASVDKMRRVVKGTEEVTSETVAIVVYMPEEFTDAGTGRWQRASR